MQRTAAWFPGYTVAAVATVAYFASAPGQTLIVALFNSSLREEFGLGSGLNTAYTIATVAASIPLVIIGSLTDRFGPRRMLALVAFLFGLGCIALSAAQGLVTVFVGFFLIRLFGQGSMSLVSSHALAMWFHRRLGSMNGLKQVVVFAGWAVLPAGAVLLSDAVGWRRSYVIFGVSIWVLVIPLSLIFIRNRPEDLGLRTDNDREPSRCEAGTHEPEVSFTLRQALRTRAYWTLAIATVLPPLIGTAMLFDLQPILAERGIESGAAPIAAGAWSLTMAIMAIPSGVLTDRARPSVLIVIGMGAVAVSAVLLQIAGSTAMAVASFVVYAMGGSLGASSAAATVARYFGRLHHGAIRSWLTRLAVIGTGLGPLATAASFELTGGYGPALWAFAAACLPVVLASASLRRPPPPPSPTGG